MTVDQELQIRDALAHGSGQRWITVDRAAVQALCDELKLLQENSRRMAQWCERCAQHVERATGGGQLSL